MPKRTTMFAIVASVIAFAVIAYLVSRPRTPAMAPAAGGAAGESSAQRSDEERALAGTAAGFGAVGDVIGAIA